MASSRPRVVTSRETGPGLGDLSGPFLLALLGGDEAAVEEIVARSRSRGADTALVVRDLVMPALSEVGRMWVRGEASIAEEHLATALVSRVLARSSGGAAVAAGRPRRLVLACLAGEFHELGIRFLADVAREAGWDAESLGANVPRESLVRFVAQRRPAALALSISLAGHVPEAARAIAEVGADAGISDAVALRDWLRSQGRAVGDARPNGHVPGLPESMPAALRRRVSRSR